MGGDMDESIRFNMVLEAIVETIGDYGEDTVVEAFRIILDRFDYEVVKRDPGPDEDVESGNVWPREDAAAMHRHHTFVDHMKADHGHGACSDHAHWAMGTHEEGVEFELSTPGNDPLGWPRESDEELAFRAFRIPRGKVIDATGRWS